MSRIVLLVVGFGLPIILSWLGYLPYTTKLIQKANGLITYPSSIGSYNIKPLPFLLGYAPTIGQSLYIFLFIVLNIILTSVSYKSFPSNTVSCHLSIFSKFLLILPADQKYQQWFEGRYSEILAYVSCRTGVFAFALLPLVILFSSRNNFLLWITNVCNPFRLDSPFAPFPQVRLISNLTKYERQKKNLNFKP